ncbi:MAG TPA: ATP-binding protein [Candidatus Acidoferrum sp.]|nr:ATP-binding protein [Candidatus Acidoferrum sp.]
MKPAASRKSKEKASFETSYEALLNGYANHENEAALRQAYELGRRALLERKSLVELATMHHQALEGLLREGMDEKRRRRVLQISCDFLAECLSPYEMAHRGFQDAVGALRRLNETLEEEIKRVAYAVHDEAGQLLVAVHLALADLTRKLRKPQQEQAKHIADLLKEVENHLRRYSHELRPTILDDLGWIPAIRFLAEGISKRVNLRIQVRSTVSRRLPSATETALYRAVQEALTNTVKHANARNVWIEAWNEKSAVCCCIRDDGSGFDTDRVLAASGRKGLGMIAMQERVNAVGGTLRIESGSGRGTKLLIQVSVEKAHANSHPAGR